MPDLAGATGLEALWIKREDRSAVGCGGNKVRGLELLFAGVAPGTVFVTVGGTGSTHCLATAVHARAISCAAVLAQFSQPDTDVARAIAVASERAAASVVRARSLAGMPLAVARAWRAARRYGERRWIPGGGAEPHAVVGQMLAGLELAGQLHDAPDAIVVPLGSGGTAAGLALTVGALRWPTRVVGVRVASLLVANRWRVAGLARGAVTVLARRGIAVDGFTHSNLVVRNGLGRGYGHPSPAGESARALAAEHGLTLDPTYGAKAFATLPALAGRGCRRVVFWHTFGAPPPTDITILPS
jgi:1-aminocyclopropane-1-carboxylate deaminase/D-cysteine desulfhydrase-like pyridoxal-dependent ACC family enzyme